MTAGENPEPSTGALLLSLVVVMLLSTASALSGVGKGIKWLSNTNMVLSFSLLAFFLIFGATAFAFELLGKGIFNYIIHLPAMTLTVWDPSTELGGWQTGWSVFFWAWAIAFGTLCRHFPGSNIKKPNYPGICGRCHCRSVDHVLYLVYFRRGYGH